jgi:hypothetical protein
MCIFQLGAGIATGWTVENVQTGPESYLGTYSVDHFVSVKRTRRHFDHFTPSTAEVKNDWMCTNSPSVRLCDVNKNFIYRPVEYLTAVTTNIAWALTVLKSPCTALVQIQK